MAADVQPDCVSMYILVSSTIWVQNHKPYPVCLHLLATATCELAHASKSKPDVIIVLAVTVCSTNRAAEVIVLHAAIHVEVLTNSLAVMLQDWICNSSICMTRRGLKPTGIAIFDAQQQGFASVAHHLQVGPLPPPL